MSCVNKRKSLYGIFIFLVLSILIFPTIAEAGTHLEKKHILVINSYHEGFTWTQQETEGITDVLTDSGFMLDISVEYMDWKNYPTEENLNFLKSFYLNKYQNRKIDVIIATDDAALDFALKNRSQMFSDAPVVFCGVNEVGVKTITAGYGNFTGILEQVDPKENIRLAIEAMPDLKNIYVVYDNTESGYSTGRIALNAINTIRPDINGYSINNMTFEGVLEAIGNVPENSAVYIVSFYTDTDGKSLAFEQFCEIASRASNVPVFNLYDFTVGHGAIGGNMLSGRLQGEMAAQIALRVLNGEAASDIPISKDKTNKKIYDYEQLLRFHIPLSRIDSDSEIINKPFSFFETYKTLVYLVIGIIVILTLLIVILVAYIRRLKIAEKQLQDSHYELTCLYQELAVSKEEIKNQCDELEVSQARLKESEERYRLVLDGSNDMIWDVDLVSKDYYFSDRWFDMVGYDRSDDISFEHWNSLLHPDDAEFAQKAARNHFKRKTPYYRCEYRLKCKNGEYKWFLSRGKLLRNKNGKPVRFAGSLSDIDDRKKAELKLHENYQELEATYEELYATQAELSSKYKEMKVYQDKLHRNAYHDTLTGLPNRLALYEKLDNYFRETPDESCALLYVDSDNFKFINDTMGHSFGDKFIKEIGKRLSSHINEKHSIYRLGGDEFIIHCCGAEKTEDVENFADKIIKSFNIPFEIADKILYVTVSIGISIYPQHGTCADELMQHADIAMYRAKSLGKNKYFNYNHDLQKIVKERMDIEKNLRSAMQNHEFLLYYQPQMDMDTGRISGFEALLRWNNPELGMVPPLKFIGIAEETHLIISIGEWVLENACKFLGNLHIKGYEQMSISVNVSILQLLQEDFTETVLNILKNTGIEPCNLELEITESILMQSYQIISDKLYKLKEMGVRIALDDFGQGYSSLSYLRQLPINTLKIDKSFIDSINSESPKNNFIDTIIMLGHKMGLVVLAEGVETREQMNYLIQHKCQKIQGYLISKPVPQDEALKLCEDGL